MVAVIVTKAGKAPTATFLTTSVKFRTATIVDGAIVEECAIAITDGPVSIIPLILAEVGDKLSDIWGNV